MASTPTRTLSASISIPQAPIFLLNNHHALTSFQGGMVTQAAVYAEMPTLAAATTPAYSLDPPLRSQGMGG
eukprot:6191391-Prymnesium_polylepis.1